MTSRTLSMIAGIVLAFISVVVGLKILGRPWMGEYYSQKVIDWWAWSHFGHGIMFCAVAKVFWPQAGLLWLVAVVMCVEAAWELAENTEVVIDVFRSRGDKGYEGDSVVNSLVDMGSCMVGAVITVFMLKGTVPCN